MDDWITAEDINKELQAYIDTPEGKRDMEETLGVEFGYSETEARLIAEELKFAIINAYKAQLDPRNTERYFNIDLVKVGTARLIKDCYKVIISFNTKALARRSLHCVGSMGYKKPYSVSTSVGQDSFTGEGIQDIFSLFTNGYHASNYAYGAWWDSATDSGERDNPYGYITIRSKKSREPNPFIKDTIRSFEEKHPGMEIHFPKEWGGDV